jgi:flagellar biosynthetic protein FliR
MEAVLDSAGGAGLYAAMLIFVRVGAVLAFLPGFSAVTVSMRLRLLLALPLTLLLVPVLAADLPPLPEAPAALGLLIAREALIGVFIGLLPRVALAAVQIAGTFAAYFSSLTSAMVQDPLAEQQSATVSTFFGVVALTLIFATDLHHAMLRALVSSYALFPPAAPLPLGDAVDSLSHAVSSSFAMGLQLAMPFLIGNLIVNVGLGLLGRLMPQLSVFFFGIPLQMGMHLLLMMLAISAISLVFLRYFAESLGALAAG